ncbi:MAG: hypothetical protein HDS08_06180 [Bacteroides sp.]|nr:hypothetical protein [Bacteroides sp.]
MSKITIPAGSTLEFSEELSAITSSIEAKEGSTIILRSADLYLTSIKAGPKCRILGNGSIRVTDTFSFGKDSVIDLSSISLTLDLNSLDKEEKVMIGHHSTLVLRDYPITGIGDFVYFTFEETTTTTNNNNTTVTTLNPDGVSTTLVAPCRQIFKNVKVKGKVATEEAYPEWFVDEADYSTSDTQGKCDDWAPAINKVFDLSANGIVRLQSRRYMVKSTIWVPTKGQLLGTGSGIWRTVETSQSSGEKNVDVQKAGTTIDIGKDPSFTAGCVILVNYDKSKVNAISSSTSDDTSLYNILRNPSDSTDVYQCLFVYPGGKIANLNFINTAYSTSKDPNTFKSGDYTCILVTGCMEFDQLCFQLFPRGIVWSRAYADQKKVTRCKFMYDRAQSDSDYQLDFNNVGDALVCTGNSFDSDASNESTHIRICQCFGGTIADNIINGHILITGCKAIDFTGNHLENGALMTIRNSAVNINNNFFQKGITPNILIQSDINYDASVVNLTNNSFVYVGNEDFKLLKDGKWQSGLLPEISDYDIELRGVAVQGTDGKYYPHGPMATLNISNSFRFFVTREQAAHVYPTGIKICKSYTNLEQDAESLEEFNQRSQLYSTQSALNVSNGVVITSPCVTLKNLNSASMSVFGTTSNTQWFLNSKTATTENGRARIYTYYAQFIWDLEKKLVTPAPTIYTVLANIGKGEPKNSTVDKDGNFIPSKGVLLQIGQNPGFAATAMVRIIRQPSAIRASRNDNAPNDGVDYVDIPLVNCRILLDNGYTLNGFKWAEANLLSDIVINKGTSPSKMTFMGETSILEE